MKAYQRKLRHIGQAVRREWWSRRLRKLRSGRAGNLIRLGSAHGGWTVPSDVVRQGRTAITVGVGEDISFDVELNKRGMLVHALDPTPRSRHHVERVLGCAGRLAEAAEPRSSYDLDGFCVSRFTYTDVGLWSQNTSMRFYAPQDDRHVSHSIVNLQRTDRGFDARCITLESACRMLNIREIDLLKLDVEGAEYAILKNIVDHGPYPRVLCFEFDELRNPIDTGFADRILATVEMLKKAGYDFLHIESSNTLFIRQDAARILSVA